MIVRRALAQTRDLLLGILPSIRRNGSLVLAYHNVVLPDEAERGDSSLHISVESFSLHLRQCQAEADLVSMPELTENLGRPGLRIAVTFDDAYRGVFETAISECQAYGSVPTVFVSPRLSGTIPHWDLQSELGLWSDAERSRFLWESSGIVNDLTLATDQQSRSQLPDSYSITELDQIVSYAKQLRFHVGNHSDRHANLGALSAEAAWRDIENAHQSILAQFPNALSMVAYPYGIVPRLECRARMKREGLLGFTIEGGNIPEEPDSTLLPRLNVPSRLSHLRLKSAIRGWSTR